MANSFVYDIDDDVVIELPYDPQSVRPSSSSSDVVLLSRPPSAGRVLTANANQNRPGSSNQPLDLFTDSFPYILEIVPDVDYDHLRKLLEQYKNSGSTEQCIQFVIHALLEDPSYPRNLTMTALGKRKRSLNDNVGGSARKTKHDLSSIDRPVPSGPNYFPLALRQLQIDYPHIPKQHIRTVLGNNRGLYAPSYFFLDEERKKKGKLPYRKKIIAFRRSGKDKEIHDPDFQIEREWLVERLSRKDQSGDQQQQQQEEEEEDPECEDGIDCSCCFSKYAFDRMIQCPEAHLFCRMCCRRYAAIQLGQHDHHLTCMDQSGCKQLFPESELARFLPPKLLRLYHRLKQQKEVTEASIEGLEECPFCEYKVVIDNPDERLFRCEAEDCMAITCRQCKKMEHLPKTCKEVEADAALDAALDVRHTLEEAMTRAMVRNCPKCQKSFVKDGGCNKITCIKCGARSCYICRQIIDGYEHFDQKGSKCTLHDGTESRHDREVREVAEKLKKQLIEQNPDLPEGSLDIDVPKAKQNPPNGAYGQLQFPPIQGNWAVMQGQMQQIQQQTAAIAEQWRLGAQRPYYVG